MSVLLRLIRCSLAATAASGNFYLYSCALDNLTPGSVLSVKPEETFSAKWWSLRLLSIFLLLGNIFIAKIINLVFSQTITSSTNLAPDQTKSQQDTTKKCYMDQKNKKYLYITLQLTKMFFFFIITRVMACQDWSGRWEIVLKWGKK